LLARIEVVSAPILGGLLDSSEKESGGHCGTPFCDDAAKRLKDGHTGTTKRSGTPTRKKEKGKSERKCIRLISNFCLFPFSFLLVGVRRSGSLISHPLGVVPALVQKGVFPRWWLLSY
jgi:hypothetical protein